MNRYKVLWIDDQPSEEFINEAFENKIDIVVAECHNEGIALLKNPQNSWDAIILDANCKVTDDPEEAPSLESLTDTIHYIKEFSKEKYFIPWFVYTGGGYEGFKSINNIILKNRDWDDRKYYDKPKDRNTLFINLKKAADDREFTSLRHRFKDVCEIYPFEDILEILFSINKDEISNSDLFNKIRKILDWVMKYCNDCGVLPIQFNGSNLSECSNFLGKEEIKFYVPIYIQRSFHSCVVVSSEGSHRLSVDEAVKSGLAPYLLRSTVFELLNILTWCKSLPTDKESIAILKVKISALLSSSNLLEEIVGTIEQDEIGHYHCNNCFLSYNDMKSEYIGKKIKIRGARKNNREFIKETYPYFASKYNFEIFD